MSSSKPLTDMECRNAKHNTEGKGNKLFDGGGLFLELMPSGSKKWRLKFRFDSKENRMSFGDYPTVSLSDARERREAAKKLLATGTDPARHRDEVRRREAERSGAKFTVVAGEWIDARRARWTEAHAARIGKLLERDIYPYLGKRPISEIRAPELLAVIHKIEKRNALEVAKKALQTCGQIFRFAVATDRAKHDLTADLRDALTSSRPVKHMARVDESELPELLRKIDAYQGEPETRLALKFLSLTFVRTIELREAEWSEIDTKRAEWRIPGEKMKKRRPHIVPLSRQALAVLEEVRPLTGGRKWVFTSPIRRDQPLSANFVLSALGRMGFRHTMTGHGFRGLASTVLNERDFNSDWIERQLAHVEGNGVRAAYNHAQYLPQRREMMQWWADYLDKQRRSNVLQFAPRRS
ncbi:tyrosine-type recombinase/integrase [Paraburkholderia sediminicola]|uniref:tyrosine-type recombinase/integrase n=1 Tax=Paraburkholderia sediminicola TaxID=458836 RepID=UPI0038BA41C6